MTYLLLAVCQISWNFYHGGCTIRSDWSLTGHHHSMDHFTKKILLKTSIFWTVPELYLTWALCVVCCAGSCCPTEGSGWRWRSSTCRSWVRGEAFVLSVAISFLEMLPLRPVNKSICCYFCTLHFPFFHTSVFFCLRCCCWHWSHFFLNFHLLLYFTFHFLSNCTLAAATVLPHENVKTF